MLARISRSHAKAQNDKGIGCQRLASDWIKLAALSGEQLPSGR